MSSKLEKLQQLINIANDGLTREEFLESFQKIMGQILSIEVKVLEKSNNIISELKAEVSKLKGDTQIDTENVKNKLLEYADHMFKEQRQNLSFIQDKVRGLENGRDGDPGSDGKDGKDGKDADETKIISEILRIIKFPDYTGQFKALQEEIEAIKRMRRLGGGGTNYLGIQQHFVDDEVPSGLVNDSNTVFTITFTPNPSNSLKVYVNGQRMKAGGTDYTVSNKTITFVTAPPTGSIILVDYMK